MKGHDDMIRQARKQRELLLLRYTDAIISGDLSTVSLILDQATNDLELERSIWETHLAIGAEMRHEETRIISEQLDQDSNMIKDLASAYFSTSATSERLAPLQIVSEEVEPVTVGEVAADLRNRVDASTQLLLRKIEHIDEPLGQDVSPRGLRTLLAHLGIENVSKHFLSMFQDTVFALGIQRQGHAFRLAATRRQQSSPNQASNTTDSQKEGDTSIKGHENKEHE